MNSLVVDASVAIKWFIPEIHSINAIGLLDMPLNFVAPDLIFSEMGNILWKKYRQKDLSLKNATQVLYDFKRTPIDIFSNELLFESTWDIATNYGTTFYDSSYLALAHIKKCLLITADKKLYTLLRQTRLSPLLLWVEDV